MCCPNCAEGSLFDFFVDSVPITVSTELFQFQSRRRIAAILAGGIAGNARRTLAGIAAAFRTFDGDDVSNPFFACHDLDLNSIYTQSFIITHPASV